MHDRRDENDMRRDAMDRAREREQAERRGEAPGRVDDGTGLVPDTLAKREQRDRHVAEREAESGGLGTGIGDDRPGRAAPHEGEPE